MFRCLINWTLHCFGRSQLNRPAGERVAWLNRPVGEFCRGACCLTGTETEILPFMHCLAAYGIDCGPVPAGWLFHISDGIGCQPQAVSCSRQSSLWVLAGTCPVVIVRRALEFHGISHYAVLFAVGFRAVSRLNYFKAIPYLPHQYMQAGSIQARCQQFRWRNFLLFFHPCLLNSSSRGNHEFRLIWCNNNSTIYTKS